GTSFAMWRQTKYEGAEGMYFRLDFILEGALPDNSGSNLRRRIDAAFPPVIKTVWLDQDSLTPGPDVLPILNMEYSSAEDGNIRPEHWPMVFAEIPVTDWAVLCGEIRRKTEALLKDKWRLEERVAV